MSQGTHHPPVEQGHEKRDVSFRGIMWFVAIFIATAVVLHFLLAWLLVGISNTERQPLAEQSPLIDQRMLPPEPRLQANPGADQAAFLARENQALTSYGWVDRQQQTVHIPIERAMDLLLERGLPTSRPSSVPPVSSQ